jgi:hypothetical protein
MMPPLIKNATKVNNSATKFMFGFYFAFAFAMMEGNAKIQPTSTKTSLFFIYRSTKASVIGRGFLQAD